MTKPLGLLEIRQALSDKRFLDLFPELKSDIDKYLKEPHCGSCVVPLCHKIMKYKDRLQTYFPGRTILPPEEEGVSRNQFFVINCHIDELESKLRKLGPGKKYISMARWEDQVTVIINELNVLT